GMPPAFSSFGCAELVFPRDAALQRLETRFPAELFGRVWGGPGGPRREAPRRAPLLAKQSIVGEELTLPLSRIGGESLFRCFQPKTIFGEKKRSADELIAGARAELQQHRDSVHLKNLRTLDEQREAATAATTALLTRTIDEALDRDGYASAIALAVALVDPLPDVRDDADAAPRNVVT